MHEVILRDFFAGAADVATLRKDLIGTLTVADTALEYEIVKMAEPFRVTPAHLVRLCQEVIEKRLPAGLLESVAFCIIASERFSWADTAVGDLVAETLNDWACPKTSYPLTVDNIKLLRERLVTGKNVFKAPRS